jgi:hypothetical protein
MASWSIPGGGKGGSEHQTKRADTEALYWVTSRKTFLFLFYFIEERLS